RPGGPGARHRERDLGRALEVPGRHREDGGRAGGGDARRRAGRAVTSTPSKLGENVLHFTRLLRGAGLKLGPASALDALAAAAAVDVLQREELYWALHAVLVRRPEDDELFDQAFRLFWRDPMGAEAALAQLLPHLRAPRDPRVSRRVAEAWRPPTPTG